MSSNPGQPHKHDPEGKGAKPDQPALVQPKAGQKPQRILDAARGQCKHQPLDCQNQSQCQDQMAHGLAGASSAAGSAGAASAGAGSIAGAGVVGPTEAPLARPASDRR